MDIRGGGSGVMVVVVVVGAWLCEDPESPNSTLARVCFADI
jgi:hypothetical protein